MVLLPGRETRTRMLVQEGESDKETRVRMVDQTEQKKKKKMKKEEMKIQ